ncbi:hypothetical protein [Alcaligenes faecalis]|uniref:hypothetical protein n=1 Tax=Alcaligenes faecalis TaxID=511 RepID=UPI001EEF7F54|nr:hypothetical protein [Alcaligenes faecalis]ULH06468.1 hypothetical protein MF263_17585 [Alcaligenes faecalis]
MRLWRVSSSPWEKQCESTPWFNAKTTSIAIFHASPLAAICARLLEQRLPHPERMPASDRLFSVEVSRYSIYTADVSRHWHVNLKETREAALTWRTYADEPVLCVPSLSGAYQYLIDTKSASLSSIRLHRPDARPFKRSLREARQHLLDEAEWLVLP